MISGWLSEMGIQSRELTSQPQEGRYPLWCCRGDMPNTLLESEQVRQEQRTSMYAKIPKTTCTRNRSDSYVGSIAVRLTEMRSELRSTCFIPSSRGIIRWMCASAAKLTFVESLKTFSFSSLASFFCRLLPCGESSPAIDKSEESRLRLGVGGVESLDTYIISRRVFVFDVDGGLD
jgi:hypothetical protein